MYRRILVAIDNSHGTPHVLDEALKLAGVFYGQLQQIDHSDQM
jgi:nucleotide-binding universal stress UspA family protein